LAPRQWLEFAVEAHPEAVDAVANVFEEYGSGGVAIEQPVSSHIESEEPPRFEGLPTIRAYFPLNGAANEVERRVEEALWHLQAFDLSPVGVLRRRIVDEEDWAEAWKEHFHPLKLGRIVIKPTWRTWDAEPDEIVVELDPGMAFGTGLHPTTRLMLEALPEHVQPLMRVLDLGTGSGILAIPAAMLGARVEALDISEVAAEVARANVEANGLTMQIAVRSGSIDRVEGRRYDLILANIIASVLIDLAPALRGALGRGGTLLASGIVEERVDAVREAFLRAGLHVVGERRQDDWWLLIAQLQETATETSPGEKRLW
jgi:ribosomal protein L11 methyltransferase